MKLQEIRKLLKKYKCIPGERFIYHSSNGTISYVPGDLKYPLGALALLHEIAHLKLGHKIYKYDLELLQMEEEAWKLTEKEAKKYEVPIDKDHIEFCLDTYRDWVNKRTTCPCCHTFGLQKSDHEFLCTECAAKWKVNQRKDREVRRMIIK